VRRRVRFDPGCALVEHWARRAQGEGRFCAVARLDEHDTGLSSARCPALPVGLRADRLEQLEDGIEDVFHTPFVGVLVRCFGGEELVDAAHGRRLRDAL